MSEEEESLIGYAEKNNEDCSKYIASMADALYL